MRREPGVATYLGRGGGSKSIERCDQATGDGHLRRLLLPYQPMNKALCDPIRGLLVWGGGGGGGVVEGWGWVSKLGNPIQGVRCNFGCDMRLHGDDCLRL